MGTFDDSHFRLGRVTNMDERTNNAMISILESSINELKTLVNSDRFSGDKLDAMIYQLSTLQNQLDYQKRVKTTLDKMHCEQGSPLSEKLGVFINNHDDYDEVMSEHIARCIDDNFNGLTSSKTAKKEIQCIRDKWINSSKTNSTTTTPHILSNGVSVNLDVGYSRCVMNAIINSCEKIIKDRELPIKAFKFGYTTYLKLMQGSNPIEKNDVRVQDFTMVSIAYNVLNDGGLKIRPMYKFNIPVNGNTVYLSFVVYNGKAMDVNWKTSLNGKKAE